jgi:hypothetical protein
MRSLDDLLAASKWAGVLSAEQWQRARTGIVVSELQTGNYVCRKSDPYVWVGVIDGLVKAENLSGIGKSRRIRRVRQKNQIELNSGTGAEGGAQRAAVREIEASAAKASLERPARADDVIE